ncbi:uncharacterized protein M6B38_126975 [Iris pallida]|uniref:Uncharacterized protein n=1 Tax=Iris pallida TaxID=29817 RepID=A0AAX6GG24_IRIPA|nr:uncharacterized protein M6B38_126975 [Iris pallida]
MQGSQGRARKRLGHGRCGDPGTAHASFGGVCQIQTAAEGPQGWHGDRPPDLGSGAATQQYPGHGGRLHDDAGMVGTRRRRRFRFSSVYGVCWDVRVGLSARTR